MATLNRRQFLSESALFAAAAAAAAQAPVLAVDEKAVKADVAERLRVAVVGVKGRGMAHVGGFTAKSNNCVITTVCDCDEGVIGPAMKKIEDAQGKAPKFEKDIRKVVADKDIDVIAIATPNHWHALAAIWALQNGKHVYVEKPVSHNVSEGRRIVEAARKYKKICQAGTQSRSTAGMRGSIEFLRSGKLGQVKVARGLCYKNRPSIGKVNGPQQPPKTMDYDLWCGPAPLKQPMRNTKNGTVHYDWHWIWDYGNGDLGNQGIHEMDKARWGLGKAELPKSAFSIGGRFGYVDDGETPNTQICVFDYGDSELIFEVRGLPSTSPYPNEDGKKGGNYVGNIWYCSEGYLVCPSYSSGTAFTPKGEVIKTWTGGSDAEHFTNFVKAVRSGNYKDLNGDIEEGHLSSALCHLGNVSYRLGAPQTYDKGAGALGDDKEAVATLERMRDHLKSHNVMLDGMNYQVGRKLNINPKTETFVSDKEADTHLTREYRKGFEVPTTV